MHRKSFFFIMMFCIVFSHSAFADTYVDTYEEREGRGLVVLSEPSNAKVYINGIERGHTPLALPDLMPGSYEVLLEKESYENKEIVLTVPRRGRIIVSLDLEKALGTLIIQPKKAADVPVWVPFNPEIYVNGEQQTEQTISLPVGFQNVLVKAFGFEDVSAAILIRQDRTEMFAPEMKGAFYQLTNARIRRARFNPDNAGSLGITECVFEASASGKGMFRVSDNNGTEIYSMMIGPFSSWTQTIVWNGRSNDGEIVPDGTYTITIETESIPWNDQAPVKQSINFSSEVDSSLRIFPASMASAKSGLLFAAGTDILPQGSYQFDALMLFGKPLHAEKAWSNLPLAFSFRISPLSFLEAAVSLNVIPEFGGETIIGAGGSVKWKILNEKNTAFPLGFAAILSYGWAQEGPITPFAMGTGIELALPVSWNFIDVLSLSLSPGLLWAGPSGFPESAAPSGILSAGIAYRHSLFNSGISLRTEYFFEKGMVGPITLGGEIKFFPQPSVFVLSAIAGIVYEKNSVGGFGGIGLGFIQ